MSIGHLCIWLSLLLVHEPITKLLELKSFKELTILKLPHIEQWPMMATHQCLSPQMLNHLCGWKVERQMRHIVAEVVKISDKAIAIGQLYGGFV